jgi:hypothetical protein
MTDELVSKRLAMEKGRDDQFEGFLRYREEWVRGLHLPQPIHLATHPRLAPLGRPSDITVDLFM